MVPLFLYLLWDRKNDFRFSDISWNPLGFLPIFAAIFLIVVGELGSVETLMYIGLWGCVVGIVFLLYGWRIRHLAFPLLILAFIVPLPPYINHILTFQLKLAASAIATFMLRLSGVSVFLDGNIIDLGVTQLQVVEACSGLRYLMPLFLLALLIGYFFTKGWWRNGVLVLLVVPLSVFFNALRIWLSGILTVKGHPELVENFFHDFSGWVIFMMAGAILFGVTRIMNRVGRKEEVKSELKSEVPKVESENELKDQSSKKKGNILAADARRFTQLNSAKQTIQGMDSTGQAQTRERDIFPDDAVREKPSAASQIEDNNNSGIEELRDSGIDNDPNVPNAPNDQNVPNELTPQTPNTKNQTPPIGFAKPIAITVIACLLFVGSGYALKKIPSATNLPERQSFQSFPINIGQWEGRRSYIPQEILDQLWADDYVEASFVNPDTRNVIHLLIPFYEWQGTRHTIHAPQACLLGGGWALTGSKERMVTMEDGREIPVMTLMLEKGNAKIMGSYFFFQRGRVLTNPWMNKAYLMWDAFTKRRTDGALVRAELMMAPGQSVDDAWEKLEGFITELWPILPRHIPL